MFRGRGVFRGLESSRALSPELYSFSGPRTLEDSVSRFRVQGFSDPVRLFAVCSCRGSFFPLDDSKSHDSYARLKLQILGALNPKP